MSKFLTTVATAVVATVTAQLILRVIDRKIWVYTPPR
jgi:hypothetical protein